MKNLRPFRFGINAFGALSRDAWVAMARKVEALGYSTLVLGDHLFAKMGPVAALVAAAEATTTLRLGSFMFANDFRHPVFMAQEAATIDLLSNGRFELGLGTGWLRSDYEQSGIAFEAPGVRVARMQEAVQVVKGLWADAPFTHTGAYYKVNGLNGLPKPVQKPRPPIMIGGGGEQVTLKLTAQYANIWNGFGPADRYKHKNQVLNEWCEKVGRNPADIERSITVFGPKDLDQYLEAGATHIIMGSGEPWDMDAVEELVEWRDRQNRE